MLHFKTLTLCLLAIGSIASAADYAEVERLVENELRSSKTPGAAIAIVEGTEVVFSKGFGLANVETKEPATPEMLFRLGSTTKMFTAAALVTLAEDGKLQLQQPIGEAIPRLHSRIAALTPHQLLTHTAGLTDESVMSGRHDDEALGAGIRAMDENWLFTEPDQIHSYANPGYWIAGLACETLDGKPYADVLQARLFRPLGMQRTTLRPTEAMTWPLALGHDVKGGEPRIVRPQADNTATWPAGQIYSSAAELSRFAIAFLNGGKLDGKQVLAPAIIEKLSTPHVERPGSGDHYGYGLMIANDHGVRILQHGGSRLGYGSTIRFAPERKIAVIVLTNRSGSSLPKAATRAMEIALGLEAKPQSKPHEAEPLSEQEITDLVGIYTNHRQTIELSLKEGVLHARRRGSGFAGWSGQVTRAGQGQLAIAAATNGDGTAEPVAKLTVVAGADGKPAYLCLGSRALKKQPK